MPAEEPDYAHAITRTAVAQIIYAQAQRLSQARQQTKPGVKTARPVTPATIHATMGVADALADIAAAFIEQLGRSANARTELAGRTTSNLLDVLAAVNSLYKITKSTPRDLAKYAMYQELPFPYPIPAFPVLPPPRKKPRHVHIESDDNRPRGYIEGWMPPLPSAHTFVSTPVYVNPAQNKKKPDEIAEQRRGVEKSLAQLKQVQAGKRDDALLAAAAAAVPENPFLAPPKVGSGRIFDEDMAGQAREPTEPIDDTGDQLDSNANLIEMPKGASHDQKRARVDRILADMGGNGDTTAVGGGNAS